jgi:polyhydroxybutyrate depolymerase
MIFRVTSETKDQPSTLTNANRIRLVCQEPLSVVIVGLCLALAVYSAVGPESETFKIDGVERQALVYSNSKAAAVTGAPVVFVFHGHGGTAQNVARRFRIHELWPEAVVVYMQGIPGVVGIRDTEARQNGWQKTPGEVGARDLKFFDAALERIQKKYKSDPYRVYVIGHSNGGRFVNVLWNARGDKLAALCSAAGPGGRLIQNAAPKPVFIIAGEKDPLVPFQGQQLSIELARKRLNADQSKAKVNGLERTEPGIGGTELVTYVHSGGHEFPVEALPSVIKFFQRHVKHTR